MTAPDIATAPESATSPLVEGMGSPGTHEFIRYFIASAIALVVDAGSLYLLTDVAGLPYLYSGAIAFILGLTIIYVLSVTWVFDRRVLRDPKAEFLLFAVIGIVGDPKAEFLLFAVIGIVGLGINEAVLWVATDVIGLYYLISKVLSVIFVFSWNFGARKYALFR